MLFGELDGFLVFMHPEAISEKKIQRVLTLSRINGWSIVSFAALCSLVVLLMGDFFGFFIGIAVSSSGLMELRGNRLLTNKDARASLWLVVSQIYLIAVLWVYAAYQLLRFDSEDPWAMFSPEFKDRILSINPDAYLVEVMIRITYPVTYFALILVVLIYQGGLCLYYISRKKYLYAEQD